jgi:hypothetical protein
MESLISQNKRVKGWYREGRKDYAAKRGGDLRQRSDLTCAAVLTGTVGNLYYTYHMWHIQYAYVPAPYGPYPTSQLCRHRFIIMAPVPSRAAILRLINASQHTSCPCHGSHTAHNAHAIANQLRRLAIPVDKVEKEYAFEVFCSFLALIRNSILSLGCCIQSTLWRRRYP